MDIVCIFEETKDTIQKRGVKHHPLYLKKYNLNAYFKTLFRKKKKNLFFRNFLGIKSTGNALKVES